MWACRTEDLGRGRATHYSIECDARYVTYADAVHLWQHDAEFRAYFNSLLAASPFTAFRWETPPVTAATADRAFEFVLLDAPSLERPTDAEAFAEHFTTDAVVSFPNLRGDAVLVAPCPAPDESAYGHLAAFVRHAPAPQQHALWARVGEEAAVRLGLEPVWISTAGAGVSWLHVRLDDTPKYYGHAPYRAAPGR
ncbi:DUF6940 family protein [Gemmata sp.]|uniref:DUF6940 family protein n=1 Tax=Gemmata sp. TaxID=1914242 RepID=UPI003F71A483